MKVFELQDINFIYIRTYFIYLFFWNFNCLSGITNIIAYTNQNDKVDLCFKTFTAFIIIHWTLIINIMQVTIKLNFSDYDFK